MPSWSSIRIFYRSILKILDSVAGTYKNAFGLLQSCPGLWKHPGDQVFWPSLREDDRSRTEEGSETHCVFIYQIPVIIYFGDTKASIIHSYAIRKQVRFVIMGNLFCTEFAIHRRFDLKGSSHGRLTAKPESEIEPTTTLKDLDLNFIFRLNKSWFQEFCR